ncbi:DUF5818 domain-containing protein [uncultured Sphingomonas sp.]|uniref:DUF5818 domain-containing protein n=1 Tax=uncultured Sphingomonas sp. TaxID=158754 RepID=UPI0030DA98D1
MPIGSRHDETGLLLREGRALTLQRDGGGRWRLDAPHKLEKLSGCRVRVIGVRDGFDLLAVERFDLA